jgi:hypothetical protein
MEQWKVKTDSGYVRTYDLHQGAKRDYGKWCKVIEDEDEDEDDSPSWVKMFYREDISDKWKMLQEFAIESDDEDAG